MAVVAVIFLAPHSHGAVIALDNTNSLALQPDTRMGSTTTENWNGKVFTVGSSDAVMKELVLPLYVETTPNTHTINFELFAVDGSNFPTGSALASDSFTQALTSTATYYTFATTLGDFTMLSGQKYALVVSSDSLNTGNRVSWTGEYGTRTQYPVYTPAAGWAFDANIRTTSAGASWSTNTYYNGMMMTVTVPEPSTVILAGIALGAFVITKRRKKSVCSDLP